LEFKIASAKRQISAAIAVAQIFNSHAARAVLKFHAASLKDKFLRDACALLWNFASHLKAAKFKIYALFWRGKISNLLLQSRILNFTLCINFRFYRPRQMLCLRALRRLYRDRAQ
jgi:hypothetical protein